MAQVLLDPAIPTKVIEIDDDIVGSVGMFSDGRRSQANYWIRGDMWGRGVATAALAAFLKEATARPVHARVVEDNIGSIRVLERNGFVLVGSEDSFAEGRQATVTELIYQLSD